MLLGTMVLFVLSALSLYEISENHSTNLSIPEVTYVFQIVLYIFFFVMILLSNIMYFSLSKTIYLLISLIIFLAFLGFYWLIIKHEYFMTGFFSFGAIFLVILNYYILRNYFKPIKEKTA
jgi:L-asparagine transporter-like permease